MKRHHTEHCCGDEFALIGTETEWSVVASALREAADLYERDFMRRPRAASVRALADKIEQAGL